MFGELRNDPSLTLQERHLGLVQAGERSDLDELIGRAAQALGDGLDLAGLRAAAAVIEMPAPARVPALAPLGQQIAVARDTAFGFCYPHLLDDWRAAGAGISFFSPLADEAPAEDADAIYLPGGYPELHAPKLAASTGFLAGLRDA